ncbi:hypothetical protein BBC0122_006880 [Bartonella choladocola]|uniref:Uncharacterized protein n=1 Tax=Bartonella choladocola TaxID=2750995 RepID=A0A1U9MFT4_9HYPH|nr:hypothetical protein BBC0122_006880 [Bartonella choladocola]
MYSGENSQAHTLFAAVKVNFFIRLKALLDKMILY